MKEGKPEAVGAVLARLMGQALQVESDMDQPSTGLPINARPIKNHDPVAAEASGLYDFDLAEFPLFSFCKPLLSQKGREPMLYTDTITGRDGNSVTRTWKAYPGPFGCGGASTQKLLYDLLQLYCEQGAGGSQIQFGTLRSLFLRRGERNPSKRDYDRMRRDLDILRGYDFHCTNAFWDHQKQAYVDMKWRLFGSVFFFKPHPTDAERELPFGFIEVSSVLQEVARSRGFFALGFGSDLFHRLKPLEQRLAVYLAKKFVSQQRHQRFVTDLASALPIEATEDYEVRRSLKTAAQGLLVKGLPILAAFRLERSRQGRWLAVFERRAAPLQDKATLQRAGEAMAPCLEDLIGRIMEAVGNSADRLWWTQCAKRLGQGAIERGLGLLKEARHTGKVKNPGGLLTSFLKDIAAESGIAL